MPMAVQLVHNKVLRLGSLSISKIIHSARIEANIDTRCLVFSVNEYKSITQEV